MARVLALGGCGGVGQYAVPALRQLLPDVEVVLADRDGDQARAQANRYGDGVVARTLDVTDHDALTDAMAEIDVVMNTVGPFFRFGPPVLDAAIEARCDYIDICDDPQPTLDMLNRAEDARNAEIRAIVGMGITPGVSNLLAVRALQELESATSLVTGWDVEAALPSAVRSQPSAATVHGVEQLTGTILVHRRGRPTREPPVRRVEVDFPGIGTRAAWTIGHPEPVTLPLAFPQLDECLNVMVTRRSNALSMRALGWFVNRGLMSRERAAWLAERVEGEGRDTPTLNDWLSTGRALTLPPIFALASGLMHGEPAAVGALLLTAPAGGLGGTTGVPLAVGTALLLEGKTAGPGVHAPETAFDAESFLNRLAPLCSPPAEGMRDLVFVARSWEVDDLRVALHRH